MANLAQENKELRDQLKELQSQLARLELAQMDGPAGPQQVQDLQRRLQEKDQELSRLAREKAHMSGDIGDPPEGTERFFSTVSNFRLTFPFRKPVAKVNPNGTVTWEQQEQNTVVFAPLAPPWAGSTYDTSDHQEIVHLNKLKGISPYLFRRGDRDCPRPERRPGPSQEAATAETAR